MCKVDGSGRNPLSDSRSWFCVSGVFPVGALVTDTMSGLIQRIPRPPKPQGPVLGCSKFFGCIIPVAQIAIGSVYLDDCPVQPYIPIYLIVSGVFGLMLALLSCLPCTQQPTDGSTNPLSRLCVLWNSMTSCFLFCWFIAGNVWIYSIYEPEYTNNSTNVDHYCNKTLYLFAFWITNLVYILFGLILVCGCCVMFCFFLCGRADADDHI
ncbi:transmembrane protein 272 [Paralichthys olivaceus]|uniref:transmembrane protein 272 n=1 Tax=Paralichthys olivaceus TaxID=8255 RepID=UPI0037521D68